MRPMVVFAAVMLLTPALAYAEPPPPPPPRDRTGFAVDITIGATTHAGEIAGDTGPVAMLTRYGFGVHHGRTAYLLSAGFGMSTLDELGAERPLFWEFGLEPSVRYELSRGPGWRFHVRGGWRLRWMLGTSALDRTCEYNGGCDGGYYEGHPFYRAHGPTFAVGISGRTRPSRRGYWQAFGAELGSGVSVVRRPGTNPDLDDIHISLGLNIAVGRSAR